MRRLVMTLILTSFLALQVLGQKDGKSTKPVIDQTPQQMEQRAGVVRRRTGKSIDPNKIGTPVADPKRRKGVCRTLSYEEWALVFPDIPSEYGGTVCYRK